MIFGALMTAAVGFYVGVYKPIDKSMKLDEKAMKKFSRAFEKTQEAQLKLQSREAYADKRLVNVANKKRVILSHSFPQFIEIYKTIQKIRIADRPEFQLTTTKNTDALILLNSFNISSLPNFTDKQLICGIITRGITGMMVKESEAKLSAANNTMNYAYVYESQAESIIAVYDAIIERADRISDLLLKMNILFTKSINASKNVIEKNGANIDNYSDYEVGILANSLNIALALKDIIDIPVLTEDGKIAEEGLKLIEKGQSFLNKMESIL